MKRLYVNIPLESLRKFPALYPHLYISDHRYPHDLVETQGTNYEPDNW